MKCDETKPECNRCTSTGRKCDGYVYKERPSPPLEGNLQERVSYVAARSSCSLSCITPTTWNGTMDELRGFDYFRVQTSEDLAYSLDSSLEQLVLQTSHHHEAIKHAAIALGSLGATIRVNSFSSDGGQQSVSLRRHEFACEQYFKAIKLLQKDMGRNSNECVNFALISCFLFIVFEFLQGNDQSAVLHLRSGLNILRQRCLTDLDSGTSAKEQPLIKLHPIQAEISRIFHTIDTQANMWLNLRTSNRESHIPISRPTSRDLVPNSFESVDEACQDLNDIVNRIYNFRRCASKHDSAPTKAHVPPSIYAERDSLLDELDDHRRRLVNYLACRQTFAQHPEDPHRITVLRINRKVTLLMLANYLEPHQLSFDARCQPHFWQVVSLAALILRPETSEIRQRMLGGVCPISHEANSNCWSTRRPRRVFAFFAGLIQPLYYTAIKCPDREAATKAIELLEMEPWREGSWDSAAMAKRAKMRLQEPNRARWNNVFVGGKITAEATDEEGLSIEWPLATDPLITYPA